MLNVKGLLESKENPNTHSNVKNTRTKIQCVLRKNISNLNNWHRSFLHSWIKRLLPPPSFSPSFSGPLLQLWELWVPSCLLVIAGVCRFIRFPLSYLLSFCPQSNANHRDLNAKAAWQLGYTGKGVVVSILDDGIERNHPDLSQNYVSKKLPRVPERHVLQLRSRCWKIRTRTFHLWMKHLVFPPLSNTFHWFARGDFDVLNAVKIDSTSWFVCVFALWVFSGPRCQLWCERWRPGSPATLHTAQRQQVEHSLTLQSLPLLSLVLPRSSQTVCCLLQHRRYFHPVHTFSSCCHPCCLLSVYGSH